MEGAPLLPPPPTPQSPRWKQAAAIPKTTVLSERRDRDALPPLSKADSFSKDARDTGSAGESGRPASSATNNSSISALTSPSGVYPGPPPPYSYHSSSAMSNHLHHGHNGYISPPDSQRTSVDDKEGGRQSLPSIHEALGKDPTILYAPSTAAQPAQNPGQNSASHGSSVSPTNPTPRSHPEPAPPGPSNPFASSQTLPAHGNDLRESGRMYPPYRQGSGSEESPSRRMMPELNTSHPPPSISPAPQQGQSPHSLQPPQISPSYPPSSQALNPVPAPPYRTMQPAYSFPQPAASSFAAVNSYNPSSHWRPDHSEPDDPRKAAAKNAGGVQQHYGESVKRHLDIYDLETSLNEMAEGCGRGLDFARLFGNRAHQTQRSGPTLTSLPTLQECEEMMKRQERVLSSIDRIRDVVLAQQHALAEQRSREEISKAQTEHAEDSSTASEKDNRSGGGFAGAEAKKRRGRNAPPGRCHSCNRAETPEWRRGPDGARTLCNACGLHYAKITRKHGQKAGMTSSNLRPKDEGTFKTGD